MTTLIPLYMVSVTNEFNSFTIPFYKIPDYNDIEKYIKKEFEKNSRTTNSIFIVEPYNEWERRNEMKSKITLNENYIDSLYEDSEFLFDDIKPSDDIMLFGNNYELYGYDDLDNLPDEILNFDYNISDINVNLYGNDVIPGSIYGNDTLD